MKREMESETEGKIHVGGVREILIRRGGDVGGFTEPGFNVRDPVNERKVWRRRERDYGDGKRKKLESGGVR